MSGVEQPISYATESLRELLEQVHDGRIQVPEFQRPLALQPEWVVSLLASVSLNYPIGALTLLEAGNPDLRFSARPVPGVPAPSARPQRWLIDGQFRLAALHQALRTDAGRCYYLDVAAAGDPETDRDEAIVSACGAGDFLPLHLTFGADGLPEGPGAEVVQVLRRYVLPVIVLGREMTRWTVRVHGGPDGPGLSDRFRTDS